jgi:hypothetical protein
MLWYGVHPIIELFLWKNDIVACHMCGIKYVKELLQSFHYAMWVEEILELHSRYFYQ